MNYILFCTHLSLFLPSPTKLATSNKIESVDFGRGYLCCQSYLNWATHCSLCCESNRWSFYIGTITSRCWFIRGFRTQNTHRPPDGSLLWIIAYIPLCIHTMRYVRWAISRHVSFQWWLRQCNWHKWLSAVPLIYGPMTIYKRCIHRPVIFHQSILNYPLPCTSVILYCLHDSSMLHIYRRMPEKANKHSMERIIPLHRPMNICQNTAECQRQMAAAAERHRPLSPENPINLRNNREQYTHTKHRHILWQAN